MPDQIEQAPQTLPRTDRPSDRDLQRAALRDLVMLRSERLKEEVREKHHEHVGQISRKFDEDLKQLQAQDSAMRQRIESDFEKSEKELREKLQQATWLADSVLEATHNQLRDEASKG